MILKYVLGVLGSGKFNFMVDDAINNIDSENKKNSLFIVPEQFRLQTEKKILEKLPKGILFNTTVVSFKRLYELIFRELGLPDKKPLEDTGHIIIIRKALYELSKNKKLKYFSESCYTNIGLLDKVCNIIKEFSEFNVSVEDLEKTAISLNNDKKESLSLKITDLANIYALHNKFISKEYITTEDTLFILAENIEKSSLISKNTYVYIYGFDNFNNKELEVLAKLFMICKKVTIGVICPTNDIYYKSINPFEPYHNIKSMMNKIYNDIICKLNIHIEPNVFLRENIKHKNNSELNFLSKHFFSYSKNKYLDNVENIKIISSKNKYEEIEDSAYIILSLIKSQKYLFKDIAVILADDEYKVPLKMIYDNYELPYFLDSKKSIIGYPLIELVLSALNIIIYNYKYEHIFSYLKTGFLSSDNIDISINDINIIENYVIQYNIKGSMWKKDFTHGFFENSPYKKQYINNIRKKILNSIKRLPMSNSKKYSAKDISKYILDFLLYIDATGTLSKTINKNNDLFYKNIIKNTGTEDEHIQVFNKLCSVLQKFVDILGDDKISLDEYTKMLYTAFENETISIIPPMQDQITIGDFSRTKLDTPKIVIALGMNEGIIPSYKDEDPFISDIEKVTLLSKGIEMRASSSTILATDMLKIYSILLKASDALYMLYSQNTLDGKPKKISSIISLMHNLFKQINIQKIDKQYENMLPNIAFKYLIKDFSHISKSYTNDNIKNMLIWFLNNKKYNQKLVHIEEGLFRLIDRKDDYINENSIKKIYTNNTIISSVSRLEEFKRCPFSYFLKYNIKAKKRDDNKLDSLKLGNIYHNILESFSKKIFDNNQELNDIHKNELIDIIEEIVDEEIKKDEVKSMIDTYPKYAYSIHRVKHIVYTATNNILNLAKDNNFKPKYFELSFNNLKDDAKLYNSMKFMLENGYNMMLNGKIDRVDTLYIDNIQYVKIIDYKSSDKKFTLKDLYYGIQMQLIVYLDMFIKMEQATENANTQASGGVYISLKETLDGEKISISGIDTVSKDDKKKQASIKNVSLDEIEALLKFSNILARKIGNSITSGDIKVFPFNNFKDNGCTYCSFNDICHFDILRREKKYLYLKNINEEKIWENIRQEIENEEK